MWSAWEQVGRAGSGGGGIERMGVGRGDREKHIGGGDGARAGATAGVGVGVVSGDMGGKGRLWDGGVVVRRWCGWLRRWC